MQPHSVRFDADGPRFGEPFNAAVPFVAEHRRLHPERVALHAEQDLTFGDLAHAVDRWAGALQDEGFEPGDRLLLVLPEEAPFFFAFWGALRAGMVPIPARMGLERHHYAYMVGDSNCEAAIYAPEMAKQVVTALAGSLGKTVRGLRSDVLAKRAEQAEPMIEPHPTTASDEAFLLYQAGDGPPESHAHTHGDLATAWRRARGDAPYSPIALFAAFGPA